MRFITISSRTLMSILCLFLTLVTTSKDFKCPSALSQWVLPEIMSDTAVCFEDVPIQRKGKYGDLDVTSSDDLITYLELCQGDSSYDEILSDQQFVDKSDQLRLKTTECESLEIQLSKQNEQVKNKSFIELPKRFSKLEEYSISLELSLQHYKEKMICDES
ncbi:hypothetical protein Tco_0394361 [Tanacetum coccineum]